MVALMADCLTGEPRGVHRTALLPDGSGKAAPGKMMLGLARGAAVRLYEIEAPFGLAVAAGIETALATDFRPIWACLTAGGIKALPVVPGPDALIILADNDASGTGERAAEACAARWHDAGVEVTIRMPTKVGCDYATEAT
nr:virulence-associated protein E [Rhizobium sp. Khangiran2]